GQPICSARSTRRKEADMYWIDHVGIAISDMERSVSFYSALFDAEPLQRVERRGKDAEPIAAMAGRPGLELDAVFFQIPYTNSILELVKWLNMDDQPVASYPAEAIGGLHLGLFVED